MPGSNFFLTILMSAILTMGACTVSKSQKSRKDHHHKDVKYEEDLSGSRLKLNCKRASPQYYGEAYLSARSLWGWLFSVPYRYRIVVAAMKL